MITAISTTDLKANFKHYLDRSLKGDAIIITRPKQKNAVLISEEYYNELLAIKGELDGQMRQMLLQELAKGRQSGEEEGVLSSEDVRAHFRKRIDESQDRLHTESAS